MSDQDNNVCITAVASDRLDEAAAFAAANELPFCSDCDAVLQLRFDTQGLSLYDRELDASIAIDFLKGAVAHRERFGGGKGQAIAKAIGLNRYDSPSVMDVTAGLARDAWVLATLGCRMTLLERSAVLCAMITAAVEQARSDNGSGTVDNIIDVLQKDSIEHLASLESPALPDVIYMDPMYPERNKSALVKKDMQVLHKLIGATPDESELLEWAKRQAKRRVVVKRPVGAPCVAGLTPSHQINSKKTRYDVYMTDTGS